MFHSWKTRDAGLLALAVLAACPSPPSSKPATHRPASTPAAPVHHDLAVHVTPATHHIEVDDHITARGLATGSEPIEFLVHAGLDVLSPDPAFVITPRGPHTGPAGSDAVPLAGYTVQPAHGRWSDPIKLRLQLRGDIYHPLEQDAEEYSRSFARTPGTISEQGVFLSGASGWVPDFGQRLLTFRMEVNLPESWTSVSQGKRTRHPPCCGRVRETWNSPQPMDEIYLVAGRFTEYSKYDGDVSTHVFLREPDPDLAQRYLDVTGPYLAMYDQLIGPYPYSKFAVVENFWETGYGMPSFTLLGPQVIRLPFILHSSYPHEILHNWWGNSVYVDFRGGNWCEGLTAYLGDHLLKEGHERGADYRRDTLARYRNYVRDGKDFPLSKFHERHSPATEAVGYGKSLMMFHMLRRMVGDQVFVAGLRQLYQEYRFEVASYRDLSAVFSTVAGRDLSEFFAQWVDRTGAPELTLSVSPGADGAVAVTVDQIQPGSPYLMSVPVAFTLRDRNDAVVEEMELSGARTRREFHLPDQVTRVDLDPSFDVFRRLDRREIPASLGELFGAAAITIVTPASTDPLAAGWAKLAAAWSDRDQVKVVAEDRLTELPRDRAVWLLGSHNRWASAIAPPGDSRAVDLGGERLERDGGSFVVVRRNPDNSELAVGWVASDTAAALPGLARKLPHYGKYSYLGFTGDGPDNVIKGNWSADDSPLIAVLAPGTPRGMLPPREPLARATFERDTHWLRGHVRYLAADQRRGRGIGTPELDQVADYIARAFAEAGLQPGGDDGSFFQTWTEPNGPGGKPVTLRNVIGVLPGTNPDWREQSVVVGAHYDHLGLGWPDVHTGDQGKIHNGADDNASGVAVLLELARVLGPLPRARSIVFAAFTAEEWNMRGSLHYVDTMKRWPAAKAMAMINLDTVGRRDKRTLTLLGTGSAAEWPHIATGVSYTTGVEVAIIANDPGGSDQQSFHDIGVPALQFFTGGHADYHRPTDDVDKLDLEGMLDVETFARETLIYLSERKTPLSPSGSQPTGRPGGGSRKVSLGTTPAFDFPGPGVEVAAVRDGSPAARAGLRDGDIIVAIDQRPITDLRGYSKCLSRYRPGDRIQIEVRRGTETVQLKAVLDPR